MTDRIKGVYVAFEKNIREDDAEPIINAILCIRGVLKVQTKVADMTDWVALSRARVEILNKIQELLTEK